MSANKNYDQDIIDEDLYEDIDDEEMYELVQEARQAALERARMEKSQPTRKRPFPKWIFWLIAFMMVLNLIALLPQTFSIPAIDFLMTSTKLSQQEHIQTFKQSVVVIETENSRGTGFSISADGISITNDHVVDGYDKVTIAFPEHGLFTGDVIASYPEIDLAVVDAAAENLPYLSLAESADVTYQEHVEFIGNPLRFQGIANEGEVIDYIRLSDWNEDVLMLKAPIYRGNSGSPVFNDSGQVIGVVFATLHHSEHGKVGLFVPIDHYYSYHNSEEGE